MTGNRWLTTEIPTPRWLLIAFWTNVLLGLPRAIGVLVDWFS